MTQFAVIRRGRVVGVDSARVPVSAGFTVVEFDETVIDVRHGWLYDGTDFIAPDPPPAPTPQNERVEARLRNDRTWSAFVAAWTAHRQAHGEPLITLDEVVAEIVARVP